MRLTDAEKIGGFASHYTEFEGIPLTEREKNMADDICKKISTQMPTAYDPDKVVRQIRELFCCSECIQEIKEKGIEETCGNCQTYDTKKIVRGGGVDGQTYTF